MSAFLPVFVVASDLRALKNRINAQVGLIDAIVRRTRSLDSATLGSWEKFFGTWRSLSSAADDNQTTQQMDAGQALDDTLRGLKSALSSQCFGVPAPAPKRDISFLPTWVTPDTVRAQKARISARVRALGMKVIQAGTLDPVVRRSWSEFARAWSTFETEQESWLHCSAQYRNALAFEDALPEWEEAIELGTYNIAGAPPPGGWQAQGQPSYGSTPSPGVAPGLPSPSYAPSPGAGGWPAFQPPLGPMAAVGVAPGLPSPNYTPPPAAQARSNSVGGKVMVIGAAVLFAGIFFLQDSDDDE